MLYWAHRPLSVGFSLFLHNTKEHIAMGTMHTDREDFHYESLNSEVTWSIIALLLPSLSLHNFFWCTQRYKNSPNTVLFIKDHFYILISLVWKLVLIFVLTLVDRARWLVSVKYCCSIGSIGVLSVYMSWVCEMQLGNAIKNQSKFLLLFQLFSLHI